MLLMVKDKENFAVNIPVGDLGRMRRLMSTTMSFLGRKVLCEWEGEILPLALHVTKVHIAKQIGSLDKNLGP